jgi:lipase
MLLKTREWGEFRPEAIVCVHGLTQHGGIFAGLGERLAGQGHRVVAVDLRGHGGSGFDPPWDCKTHVGDLLETLDASGIERVAWVGHSFGGRLIAEAAVAAESRTLALALLEPGLQMPTDRALRAAETERLDWSFAGIDGMVEAILSSDSVIATPRQVVEDHIRDNVRQGGDGRFRFAFCPSASVVAWSEMTLPAPAVARVPTLLLGAAVPLADGSAHLSRYRRELGDLLSVVEVPNGHNVLWESPVETATAIERFFDPPTSR